MSPLQFIALLLALLGPLLALAGLLRLPASLLLFAAGLATAFLPGLPRLQADPQLLTTLFLPPILYAATARVTWHLLRHTLLPGLLAGTAVALVTILAVAALAHWLLPTSAGRPRCCSASSRRCSTRACSMRRPAARRCRGRSRTR